MATPRSDSQRAGRPGVLAGAVLLQTLALGVLTRAARAAEATNTSGPSSQTAVGSEYGWASLVFFLVVIGGALWLWRRRAGGAD